MIRVLVVADVRLHRDGIARFLTDHDGVAIAATAASTEEAAAQLTTATGPDVVLLDAATYERMAVIRLLARHAPDIPIVVIGLLEAEEEVIACIEAGIAGYVLRDDSLEDLLHVLDAAVRGDLVCSPSIAGTLLRRIRDGMPTAAPSADGDVLTPREYEIALLVGSGRRNKEIATELFLAVPTVKNHVHRILGKLDVSSRSQIAARLRSLQYGTSGDPDRARRNGAGGPVLG